MSFNIEIVVHSWAGHHPHYADSLNYQLSSLILWRPYHDVLITVCTAVEDKATQQVARWFSSRGLVKVNLIELEQPYLFRRAIGRNIAALYTKADILWLSDNDVCFREGCLDALAAFDWPEDVSIIYPPDTWISRDHAQGDRTLARVGGEVQLIDVNPAEFVPKRYTSPIGPVQIVRGDFAREHGYLDGHPRWQRPVADGRFARCSEDPVYRRFCKRRGRAAAVDLPNVFRIRHTEAASSGHKIP